MGTNKNWKNNFTFTSTLGFPFTLLKVLILLHHEKNQEITKYPPKN